MSSALSPMKSLDQALADRKATIDSALPDFMGGQARRLILRARMYWYRHPDLQKCTLASFVDCVVQAAELGFAIDGQLCYAVPFKTTATLIPSYRGLLAVAKRGKLIADAWARIVLESDFFAITEKNGKVEYEYQPDLHSSHDRPDQFRGVLAVATLLSGATRVEWMPACDIDAIRKRSRAGNSGPWVTDPGEMAKKTALKRLLKTFSDDPGLLVALGLDDQAEEESRKEQKSEAALEITRTILPEIAEADEPPAITRAPEPAAEPPFEPNGTKAADDEIMDAWKRAVAGTENASQCETLRREDLAKVPKHLQSQIRRWILEKQDSFNR